MTYFLSGCSLCSIFRPKITRSEFSSMFGLAIPYPAAAGRSHWQLPNTFMVRKCSLANIGAVAFTSKLSCRSLIWFSGLSSLSSGIFVGSHNRRASARGASDVLREVSWRGWSDREKALPPPGAGRVRGSGPGCANDAGVSRDLLCNWISAIFWDLITPGSINLLLIEPVTKSSHWSQL